MSSTFDVLINSAKKDMQVSTTSAVRGIVGSVIQGKGINPSVIGGVVGTTIDRAMGNLLGMATSAVSKTISGALGKYSKNSPLAMVAGNVGASLLKSIITGQQGPMMTQQLVNSISQGITTELMMKLPKSLTKSINPSILGTQFNLSLTGIVQNAVGSVVGAVVGTVTSNAPASGAGNSNISLPSLGGLGSLSTSSFSLNSITSSLSSMMPSSITASLGNLGDSLGSSLSVLTSSLSSLSSSALSAIGSNGLQLPAGLDLTKLTGNVSGGLGSLLTLSSTPIGQMLPRTAGIGRDSMSSISSSLASANVNNPLASLGGKFDMSSITNATRPITKDLTSTFGKINDALGVKSPDQKTAEKAATDASTTISTQAANAAFEESKKFSSYTQDNLEKLTTVNNGFADPNAKYPLPEYNGRVETNKLATGDVKDTIVDKKNANRMLGAQLPNGDSWSEPESPFAGVYPHNKVTETESGHTIEIDDTPGAERIHVYHKSGSYVEIDAIGNVTRKSVGSEYHIVDANGYISIHGRANVSVSGQCNVFIGGDANIEVHGNTVVNGYNDVEVNAAGELQLTGGESINMRAPKIYIDADNELHVTADVDMRVHAKQFDMTVDTDCKIHVDNDFQIASAGNMELNTESNFRVSSTANFDVSASGTTNVKSNGNINMDGSMMYLNSGKAAPTAATKADPIDTEYSNAHYLEAREHSVEVVIKDTSPTNYKQASHLDRGVTLSEAVTQGNTDTVNKLKVDMVVAGTLPPKVLTDDKPDSIENSADTTIKPAKPDDVVIPPTIPLGPTGDTVPPANFKLSPHFTIGSLTTEAKRPTTLVKNSNLTIEKVVANMQFMCLNVLEKIYAAYPDLKICTGYSMLKDQPYLSFPAVAGRFNGFGVVIEFNDPDVEETIKRARVILEKLKLPILTFNLMYDSNSIYIVCPPVHIPEAATESDTKYLASLASITDTVVNTVYAGKMIKGIVNPFASD